MSALDTIHAELNPLTESHDGTLLTTSHRRKSVNNRQALRSVNQWKPSAQQLRILALAARPDGVSSHEAVIEIGGSAIELWGGWSYDYNSSQRIYGTPAARSIAASVSRSLSRLLKLGLLEYRLRRSYRDPDQRVHETEYRYHSGWSP